MKKILLVGLPNSGKSSLYNVLCKNQRKVSNYSGISVDEAKSELKSNDDFEQKITLIDLPGIYDLNPSSIDEGICIDSILRNTHDLIAVVLDFDRFEASLSLALSIKDFNSERLTLLINKDDKEQISNDQRKKIEELTGLKALSTSAKKVNRREIDKFLRDEITDSKNDFPKKLKVSPVAKQFLRDQTHIDASLVDEELTDIAKEIHSRARDMASKVFIKDPKKSGMTQKIDNILLHPILGSIFFFAVFFLIFNAIYEWSGPLMDLIDGGVGAFGSFISEHIEHDLLRSLIVDGIIAGVGGVVIFAPQIGILFLLLSLLEQSGYISRAAVLSDKVMGYFGLNGKAFLPFLSGFACSIPAIMAARTIQNEKERLATIFTIPLITCSARLPVYILLIGTFVPEQKVFGIFGAQPLSLFFLYFLGSFFALVMALIFRLSIFKGKTSSFLIDLPFYQRPSIRYAFKHAFQRVAFFCKKAGTIILALSILIWFASSFPRIGSEESAGKTEQEVAALQLNSSYIAKLGKTIEPILEPIGMDWRMGSALIVAFGARELFVSTLGTIFALGEVDEESTTLRERLKAEINPKTGKPLFNLAVAWSLLIFFVFSLQCTSTLAILKRELGGWKMPIQMFTYMSLLAWIGSFIAYNVVS